MPPAADTLSATFAALADPTRRAILARLAQGPATVNELSAPFDMSGPAVCKHLRVLERAGLVARGQEAQWRPRELRAAPLKEVADWAAEYRRFWETSFDRMDGYLRELQALKKGRGRKERRHGRHVAKR
jgi:DNA-binding transcriptional ArsR family regulator